MLTDYDYQTDYDEYIENTPLEARFDYLTIKLIVTEAYEPHKVYGMSFSEYRTERSRMANYDGTDKKRLSYYLPPFYARVAADLAFINNISFHKFMTLMIELGLIHFQVDYQDEYNTIREGRKKLFNQMGVVNGEKRYMQLDKQTITLGSCSGAKTGLAKHFSPNVPEWLANAISEVSNYLNISSTDLIFLCFCISVANCLDEDTLPSPVVNNSNNICTQFDYEIGVYSRRISDLLTT